MKSYLLPSVLKLLSNLVAATATSPRCTLSRVVWCVAIHLRSLHSSVHVLPLKKTNKKTRKL